MPPAAGTAQNRPQGVDETSGVVDPSALPLEAHAHHQGDDRGGVALGIVDTECSERCNGNALVSGETAAGNLLQGWVASGLEVQLELRHLLRAASALGDESLHLGRHLLGRRVTGAKLGGNCLQAGHLLFDVEAEALMQKLRLAGEVVGERAERDPCLGGDAPVAQLSDPLPPNEGERGAQDLLAGPARRRCLDICFGERDTASLSSVRSNEQH
jgi:hypothetical protein